MHRVSRERLCLGCCTFTNLSSSSLKDGDIMSLHRPQTRLGSPLALRHKEPLGWAYSAAALYSVICTPSLCWLSEDRPVLTSSLQ